MMGRTFAFAQFLVLTGALTTSPDLSQSTMHLFVLIVLGVPALTALMLWSDLNLAHIVGWLPFVSRPHRQEFLGSARRIPGAPGVRGEVLVRAPAEAVLAHA